MAKYHINKKSGNIAYCNATVKACPHGGEDEHYSEAKDARAAYEKLQAAGVFASVTKKSANSSAAVSKPTTAKATEVKPSTAAETGYVKPPTATAAPEALTKRQESQAVAYSKANKVFASMAYRNFVPMGVSKSEFLDGSSDVVEQKTFITATPSGGVAVVTYHGTLDIQEDYPSSPEFFPMVHATYRYYPDLKSYRARESTTAESGYVDVDFDDKLHDSRGFLTYDRYSYGDSVNETRQLMKGVTEGMSLARLAELRHSQKRIAKSTLEKPHYIDSSNLHVRIATVSRPEFTAEFHQKAVETQPNVVLSALARRRDLSRKTMAGLLAKTDPSTGGLIVSPGNRSPREELLMNPTIPASLMRKTAKEGSLRDMKALWKNPKLDSEAKATLEKTAERLQVNLASY